ncbi:ABC transporter permease [Escherichia coli]|uniref:ABC transporter permease n=1 Tax=Escherichia coli TaxID=562 RepID=A0A377K5U6_ECOLX|nr:ABC transporter permease [Escherichia coli]
MSRLSPVNQARWARFRHNRRGYWSLWIFLVLFGLSLCSELIANDKPLLVRYDGSWYFPLLKNYSESDFGGPLASQADYQDPWLKQRLENNGWVLWAPIRFGATSINFATDKPFLLHPPRQKLAGNGCQWRRCTGTHSLWHADLSSVWPDADPLLQRDGRAGGGATRLLRW